MGNAKGESLYSILTRLSLTTGLTLCLDAADIASYNGTSQVWSDRSGGGYDFNRGTTSGAEGSDPTFNGNAGGLSANEYFSFDGGDVFSYDTTVETWMTGLHADNAIFTILAAFYSPSAGAKYILDTCATTAKNGITVGGLVGDQFWIGVGNAAGSHAAASVQSTATMNDSAWNFVSVAQDESSATGMDMNINGTSETGKNGTYTSPSATAAAPMYLGGTVVGAFTGSGTRLGCLAIWSATKLSTTNTGDIYNALKARYGF